MDKYYQGPEFREFERRTAEKVKAGLIDMKFVTADDMTGATIESVCKEINDIDRAIERGDWEPFCYNDSYRNRERGEDEALDRPSEVPRE